MEFMRIICLFWDWEIFVLINRNFTINCLRNIYFDKLKFFYEFIAFLKCLETLNKVVKLE